MKTLILKILMTMLSLCHFVVAHAQPEDLNYGAFNGQYQRTNVSGTYDGILVHHPDAVLEINGLTGFFKMDSSERCFSKRVPIDVIKSTKESVAIRLKFSSIAVDCKEYDIPFYFLIENGKVGLSRVGSKIFEFEKTDIKNELLPTIKAKKTWYSGIYEVKGYSAEKNVKPSRLSDANLVVDGNKGIYKVTSATGRCYIKQWPVEVSEEDSINKTITLTLKGSTVFPDCKDYVFNLHSIVTDGYSGLAFENSTKIAFKKIP